MMINMRYYIVSIAAIFIALGLGIFIGFNMNGQDLYEKQQQMLIDSLENKFTEFRVEREKLLQQIDELTNQAEKSSSYINRIYEEMTERRLEGYNVAIIQTTSQYNYSDVRKTLEDAGAIVPLHIIYQEKLLNITDEKLAEINKTYELQIENKNQLIQTLNDHIINRLMDGEISDFLDYMIRNEYIAYKYFDQQSEEHLINQIIVAGGSEDKESERTKQIDLDFIEQCKKNNLPIIGVERVDVGYSYIPHYKKCNISTVDNIDTTIGRISLVLVTSGIEGHYGEKEYSDNLMPISF